MLYANRPEDILFANRVPRTDPDTLLDQITSCAKILVNQQNRLMALEANQVTINAPVVIQPSTRALNTDFIVNSGRNALVFYTVELSTSCVLTGSDDVSVLLFIDGTSRGLIRNFLNVTLALGITVSQIHQKILTGFVPAGQTVNLTSSGTGSATLIQTIEVLM